MIVKKTTNAEVAYGLTDSISHIQEKQSKKMTALFLLFFDVIWICVNIFN